MKTIKVSEVVFRKDLYPRLEHDQQKAQEYADNIEYLPPILVNQRNELIDGRHRVIAHELAKREDIEVEVEETASDAQLLERAIQTNAAHGLQLSAADKKSMAITLYAQGERTTDRKKVLAKLLSVSERIVSDWVYDLDKEERKKRKAKILDLYLKAYTNEEIGAAVGLTQQQANNAVSQIFADLQKMVKVQFFEEEWVPPIYNVWAFGKKTNETKHFGNTEQRITDNLLWAYTDPGDIVIDPFGGGGATLNVCKTRGRRCWISDRKVKAGMEEKIRELDITEGLPPLNKRWSEVSLVYLDPPYWAQARGEYSDDPQDLANYETADEFHKQMAKIIKQFASKMRDGSHIAMIISPTQWPAPDRKFTDHIYEIIKAVGNNKLVVENRISCPYSSEQCNAQMVEWAKENKQFLVLSRELVIWQVSK